MSEVSRVLYFSSCYMHCKKSISGRKDHSSYKASWVATWESDIVCSWAQHSGQFWQCNQRSNIHVSGKDVQGPLHILLTSFKLNAGSISQSFKTCADFTWPTPWTLWQQTTLKETSLMLLWQVTSLLVLKGSAAYYKVDPVLLSHLQTVTAGTKQIFDAMRRLLQLSRR